MYSPNSGSGMLIWIVTHGEEFEGGTVKGVYRHLADAKKQIKKIRTCFDGGWRLTRKSETEYYYKNGCDYILIESQEIQ